MTRRALLLVLAVSLFFLAAFWLVRLQSDLNWDEAQSTRTYARSPVTAVALYLEPNNHPLESLYRSLFYGIPVLRDTRFLRVPGLGVMLAFLLVLWTLARWLVQRRRWVTLAVLVLGLIYAEATQVQMLQLRGYIVSMVLVLGYLLMLIRDTDLLGGGPAVGFDGSRPAWRYGVLSALILFTVPSNLLLMPGLWTATLLARGRKAAGNVGTAVRLVGVSAGLTAFLYLPIAAGVVLGVNRLDRFPGGDVPGPAAGALAGLRDLLANTAPAGIPWWVLFAVAGVLLVVGLLVGRREPAYRVGVGLLVVIPAVVAGFSAFVAAPARIWSPMAVGMWTGLGLVILAVTRRWGDRVEVRVALPLALAALLLLPAAARRARPVTEDSDLVAYLQVRCDVPRDRMLVAADTADLCFYLSRAFGEDRLIRGPDHVEDVFAGRFTAPVSAAEPWKARLRRYFFPELDRPAVDVSEVEVLVTVRERDLHPEPGLWRGRGLDRVRRRLRHEERLEWGRYEVVVWE